MANANNRSQQVVQEASDGGGMVYDVLIMLIVAAIATLLYRTVFTRIQLCSLLMTLYPIGTGSKNPFFISFNLILISS